MPLYTLKEAEDCLRLFQPLPFGETRRLHPEFSFRFVHAGHILGSAMVEIFLNENGTSRKSLFTGDVGRVPMNLPVPGKVVHAGPDPNEDPDFLVMESTYGNREHPHEDVRPKLAELINDTVHRGGSIVVPAFAVERTQKVLFVLKGCMEPTGIPR